MKPSGTQSLLHAARHGNIGQARPRGNCGTEDGSCGRSGGSAHQEAETRKHTLSPHLALSSRETGPCIPFLTSWNQEFFMESKKHKLEHFLKHSGSQAPTLRGDRAVCGALFPPS